MAIQPPPIDLRTSDEIVDQVKTLAQEYAHWRPRTDGQPDAGQALMTIFGRLAELIIERLNQTPEKNFLAFLDLIGAQVLPPQPARAPLTFQLAAGSPVDARVPARTQVAAPPAEGETSAVLYETDQELTVTTAQLKAVFVRDPDTDRYDDYTPQATGLINAAFPVFQGNQPIEHSLYLARDDFFTLPAPKAAQLTITAPGAVRLAALPIVWSYWNGVAWQTLHHTSALPTADQWVVSIADLPAPTVALVNGVASGWLRAQLAIALPPGQTKVGDNQAKIERTNLLPDHAFAGATALDLSAPFFPFAQSGILTNFFYLNVEEAFVRAGAAVTVAITLTQGGRASSDLVLNWSYSDGNNGWRPLGASTPTNASSGIGTFAFADETRAFTQAGLIDFTAPTDWRPQLHAGAEGRWLRVQISAGDYGTGIERQLPQIALLMVDYRWALPQINKIEASIRIERDRLAPELGFTNTLPLDLSKDFYPFGEKPRLSDTLYLAQAETLAKAGAQIVLDLILSNPNPDQQAPDPKNPPDPPAPVLASRDLIIAWESWDGRSWVEIGRSTPTEPVLPGGQAAFKDGTQALTREGQVTFILPAAAQTTVNGETNYWLRIRIVRGNYGREAYYRPVLDQQTERTVYDLMPATFAPPVVATLTVSYVYEQQGALAACLSYNDFTYVDHTRAARTADELFLPFTPTTDTRPALYLGFDRPFANRTMTLYAGVEPPIYSATSAPKGYPTAARVFWEYSAPTAWKALGAQDETGAFAERGLVRFIGPRDFTARSEFGGNAYWLRVRWDAGVFPTAPYLHRILTNTTWASQALTLQNENLGSSNGEPDQIFQTTSAPVLLAPKLEVREPELPSAAERTILFREEGDDAIRTVEDASDRPKEIWVRWHETSDFYGSGPRDRHYVLDHLTGRIYFGDGQHGLIPPQGRNNVYAAVYRTGGGTRGNRAAQTITQLKSAVPYIDGVTNWEAAGGGAEAEALDRVKERGPKTLRHRDRAVTAQDFEDLAYAASPSVARARALAARNSENAGQIGIILVPQSTDAQPIPSLELINRVEEYLLARAAPTLDLWLAGPDWIRVTVTAEIAPVSFEVVDLLPDAVLTALQRFLHPLTGGPDGSGWDFGRQPHTSDLYAVLESIEGVDHIRYLAVDEERREPVRPDRFLVFSGEHVITVVAPT